MTAEGADAVQRALWPAGAAGSVWAVFDGARDPRIHLALIESRLEVRGLYSGRVPPVVERVAPQLVELLPDHRLTRRWIDEGLGQAWGIVMRVAEPDMLRHHLRKFLRVQDEAGRRLLFRFYDPRVLRTFLPACTADELRAFFGPVQAFFAEAPAGDGLLRYELQGGALRTQRLAEAAR